MKIKEFLFRHQHMTLVIAALVDVGLVTAVTILLVKVF